MKIQFISHAGFIVEINGKKIFADPWTTGKVFNDSWALYAPPADVDYSTIDYIFISHEHPDHFNFPTLKKIPTELRKKINIIYQKHASPRLENTLRRMDFGQIVTLPLYQWTQVAGIDLYCGSSGSMDSFLAVRGEGKTLLNLNDCAFNKRQYRYIQREVGKVDILFTQFSFANYVGNEDDHFQIAEKKIADMRMQIEIFSPTYTIPFASFVYFCNEENQRMNAWANTPEKILGLDMATVEFMYPGDAVDLDHPTFHSSEAVKKLMSSLQNLTIDPTPPSRSLDEIKDAIRENLSVFRKKIPFFFRRTVQPFSIYMPDIQKGIEIDVVKNEVREVAETGCRYIMCSQVAWFTFKFSWGTGTLDVSGMFFDKKIGEPHSRYFFFQNVVSTEFLSFRPFGQARRTLGFLWRKKWEIFYRYIN